MLAYVPYTFDLYEPLPRHTRDSAARMVSFANRKGECWFSVRTFARIARLSKSTASRHLAALTDKKFDFATRRWVAGVGYEYKINARFLARGAVSHGRAPAVPRTATKEKEAKEIRVSTEFLYGEPWPQRCDSYAKGHRWNPVDGPEPGQPGCRAPAHLAVVAADRRKKRPA